MHSRHALQPLPGRPPGWTLRLFLVAAVVAGAATAVGAAPARGAEAPKTAGRPDSLAAPAPADTSGLIRGRRPVLRPPSWRPAEVPDTSGAAAGAAGAPRTDSLAAESGGNEPARGPAQVSAADSAVAFPVYEAPGAADPRFAPGAGSDSTRRATLAYPRPAPFQVMLRSALVPGWGQLTNGKWWKAILVAGLEGYLAASAVSAGRDVHRYEDSLRVAPTYEDTLNAEFYLQDARNRRSGFIWWTVGAVGLSMLDAYVDAHFKNFDVTPIAAEPGKHPAGFLGLQLAWHY
ncbi:MAG TPA: DUF5683 domain-containing protein [Candidatus Saccharimonadales bacterium]|nr:DUF5683 domain-containing protein [Candidatus Saccharimonadales bacterium]